ncbi:MAG: hypothetical protein LBC74_15775 [Planctomycetaceae bacterium]|jgi:hypothetical protein|nr:hypothetical protein [Planctomycetaceae bacterium]
MTPPKVGNNSPPSEASSYFPPSEASSYSPPSEGLGVVSEELKAVFCCVDVFLG